MLYKSLNSTFLLIAAVNEILEHALPSCPIIQKEYTFVIYFIINSVWPGVLIYNLFKILLNVNLINYNHSPNVPFLFFLYFSREEKRRKDDNIGVQNVADCSSPLT